MAQIVFLHSLQKQAWFGVAKRQDRFTARHDFPHRLLAPSDKSDSLNIFNDGFASCLCRLAHCPLGKGTAVARFWFGVCQTVFFQLEIE